MISYRLSGQNVVLLVIDTNIVVNALSRRSHLNSKAQRLIHDIYRGKHEVFVSDAIVEEYADVLSRPQMKVGVINRTMWLLWIRLFAIHIEPNPSAPDRIKMKDESDRIFFDVARCAGAKLVTRNLKHYPVDELRTSIDELY